MTESRIAEGMVNWPLLAAEAGLPADGWQAGLLNSRRDAEANRLVLRLTRPGQAPVVLKQGFGPAAEKSIAASAEAQRRAWRLIGGKGAVRVPAVLAAPEGTAAMLMEAGSGQRLGDLVDRDALLPALEQAGAWLGAFHRAGPVEQRAFQPRFMVDHLSRLAAEASAGRRAIPRAAGFAQGVTTLGAIAAGARDAATVSSHRHGDLNARNLLIDQGSTWGIDFSEAGQGPVGYDIARLLVHLAELSVKPPNAGIVPGPLLSAFFSGYRLTARRDGSLKFLILARLLSDWASLPGNEADMSVFKAIRLERIVQMAEAFRPEG